MPEEPDVNAEELATLDKVWAARVKNRISPLPIIPATCMICGAPWLGGCERPGERYPKAGLRVVYECGASMSVIDKAKELEGYEGYVDLGECYFLRLKGCHSEDGVFNG